MIHDGLQAMKKLDTSADLTLMTKLCVLSAAKQSNYLINIAGIKPFRRRSSEGDKKA